MSNRAWFNRFEWESYEVKFKVKQKDTLIIYDVNYLFFNSIFFIAFVIIGSIFVVSEKITLFGLIKILSLSIFIAMIFYVIKKAFASKVVWDPKNKLLKFYRNIIFPFLKASYSVDKVEKYIVERIAFSTRLGKPKNLIYYRIQVVTDNMKEKLFPDTIFKFEYEIHADQVARLLSGLTQKPAYNMNGLKMPPLYDLKNS
jgi:hypothetical protein